MIYFISGHRDLTQEEFDMYYAHRIIECIDQAEFNGEELEFVVGDCEGCDIMAATFLAEVLKDRFVSCIDTFKITVYHMFSEPRFRIGTLCKGAYYLDCVDEANNTEYADPKDLYTLEDCPKINYIGGYESDTERDSSMTIFSDADIAFIRDKSKYKSGTAENVLRRITITEINKRYE